MRPLDPSNAFNDTRRSCDECGVPAYTMRVGDEYLCDDCISYRQELADEAKPETLCQ